MNWTDFIEGGRENLSLYRISATVLDQNKTGLWEVNGKNISKNEEGKQALTKNKNTMLIKIVLNNITVFDSSPCTDWNVWILGAGMI